MAKTSELVQGLVAKGAVADKLEDQIDVQNVAESDLARVAADEAFMNEIVEVIIFPTTDPQAPPYARPGVNGEAVTIFRNVPTKVKRKHIEVLARMKETRVTQDLTPSNDGQITMASLRGHTGLAYPFQVIKDPNPKGSAWLGNILAERS